MRKLDVSIHVVLSDPATGRELRRLAVDGAWSRETLDASEIESVLVSAGMVPPFSVKVEHDAAADTERDPLPAYADDAVRDGISPDSVDEPASCCGQCPVFCGHRDGGR